jgi:hypothetical protein
VGGERRLGTDLAAPSLEALQQRGLLAADIGAGADPHLHVESEAGAEQPGAEQSGPPRRPDRVAHPSHRMRIFRAYVDVAMLGADRDSGDHYALDDQEGVAFHEHAVGEGAAVAFVGIADDVFAVRARLGAGLPLDAGREAGPAAAAQARADHFLDRSGRPDRQRAFEAGDAAGRPIFVDRGGIDDSAAGEGQAVLALQEGKGFDKPDGSRMRVSVDDRGGQSIGIAGFDAGPADPPFRRFDLDQRLQLEQAARAGAHDARLDVPAPERNRQAVRNRVRADGGGGRIAGDEDPHDVRLLASCTAASSSSRPNTLSPAIAEGPLAHRPRQ